MKKKPFVITAVMVLLALGLYLLLNGKGEMHVEIPTDGLNYVVANSQGLGPKELDYAGHAAAIDQVVRMVNGDYSHMGSWSNIGYSGGGPYTISFYRQGETEPYTEISYVDDRLAVARRQAGQFDLYKKKEGSVSFQSFEAYLREHGTPNQNYKQAQ